MTFLVEYKQKLPTKTITVKVDAKDENEAKEIVRSCGEVWYFISVSKYQ